MKVFGIFEGGGAKGYAHVGALQAVEQRRLELAAVAGTSIGAVIALLVAAGYRGSELFDVNGDANVGLLASSWVDHLDADDWSAFARFRDEYLFGTGPNLPANLGLIATLKGGWSIYQAIRRHKHLVDRIWTRFGLTDTRGFHAWLEAAVRQKLGIPQEPIRFRDLRIPLKVVASDLRTGEIRVFGGREDVDVDPVKATVASASYPLFFQPYSMGSGLYVDGGLLSNLPAWVFDEERESAVRAPPTFGFRFSELPLLAKTGKRADLPVSFPDFLKRLVTTSISGAQSLGERAIEEYYAIDLAADIDTLAFDQIDTKSRDLVEAGRKGVSSFFDTKLGPSDPDEMSAVLSVLANFAVQALDKRALAKLGRFRAFVLIRASKTFVRVAYSAHADADADDRMLLRASSPGAAGCLIQKEPIIIAVNEISEKIRMNPFYKHEHAARPSSVVSAYAIPIFDSPSEWAREAPAGRSEPIAILLIDSQEDIRPLLMRPEFEDRMATYAQICGEYLKGKSVTAFGSCVSVDEEYSELTTSGAEGFFVSSRKARFLFQDDETVSLVERIEERLRMLQGKSRVGTATSQLYPV